MGIKHAHQTDSLPREPTGTRQEQHQHPKDMTGMLRVHRPHAAANGVPRFSRTPQRLTLGFAVPAALMSFPSPSFQSRHPTSPQQQNRFEIVGFFCCCSSGFSYSRKIPFPKH